MSKEFKAPRSVAEIQKEYAQFCTRAGHLQYQIHAFAKDLEVLNDSIRDLNFEAMASQKAEEEAKAAQAKEASPPSAPAAPVSN